ncbi:MAG: hypothetical protein QXU99_06485 [Candidatus Bathyarchaeia archaeon]
MTIFPSPIPTRRDILLFEIGYGKVIVVGCDSAGGIGPKPLDKVKTDGYTVGKFAARVALMEVLSTGAKPFCAVGTIGVEPEPTGNAILNGIKSEVTKAGLNPQTSVTCSLEKNFQVEQTGMGVTVIGAVDKILLKIGVSKPNDVVMAIGKPCFGEEVISAENKGQIANLLDVSRSLRLNFIHEVLPVGSKGVLYEANVLAESSKLKFKPIRNPKIDLQKSAGPATVLLASLPASRVADFQHRIKKPINIVGQLVLC